jgi:hypothetical protein
MTAPDLPDDTLTTTIAALTSLCDRIITVHEQVVMDTPADRELHDRACQTFRAALATTEAAVVSVLATHNEHTAADALRDAADEVGPALQNEVGGHTSTYSVRRWLRARADRLAPVPPTHTTTTEDQ